MAGPAAGRKSKPPIPKGKHARAAGLRISPAHPVVLPTGRLAIVLSILFGTALAFGSPDPPLKPGEELQYKVSWAILPGAGEITVRAESDGPTQLKITTTTSTRGIARWLLPFDATSESIYSVKSGRLLSLHEKSQTRSRRREHTVTFDYVRREAKYLEAGATIPRTLPMPNGSPSDLISELLETRTWNLDPGQARDALVIFDDEFYELTIHAIGYKDVRTDMGKFHSLVLEPRMDNTPPKGMFKRGSTVRVWIAEGDRRLPVRFDVEFSIGTGTARLVSYHPPAPIPGAGPSAPSPTSAAPAGQNAANPHP